MKEHIGGDAVLVLLICLVGVGSFGLGRLSAEGVSAIIVEPRPMQEQKEVSVSGEVVASKNGTKYHFPWCGGAARILEQNKIVFNSTEEAKQAGYTPAKNCKGLE